MQASSRRKEEHDKRPELEQPFTFMGSREVVELGRAKEIKLANVVPPDGKVWEGNKLRRIFGAPNFAISLPLPPDSL